MKNIKDVLLNFLVIVVMIALVPLIKNDYILALIYLVIAVITIRKNTAEIKIFFLGLIILTISESVFISTGVETFNRRTLFNLMPIWLPVLWGYAFVVIKRSLRALNY